MRVVFYNNRSDKRVVNKDIILLRSAECALKEPSEVLMPVLRLARKDLINYPDCNYMYIPTFKRYYFVKIRTLVGDMLEIETIRTDPLMSFASGIRSLTCDIVRQENYYNMYYQDPLATVRATKTVIWKELGELPNVKSNILTVDGGN